MAHSGRERHRDRDPRRRLVEEEAPATDRVFRITDAQRQHVAACLRGIDEARRTLEAQHDAANRGIVRELKASADEIFDVISDLEEADD